MNDLHALIVSHKRASVDQIRRLTERDVGQLRYRLANAGAEEVYVLHTCNRAEYYVTGSSTAREAVVEDIELPADTIQRLSGPAAARHLLRVAAGLESMVVGEDEILGQVSRAQEEGLSQLNGTLGPIVEKAIRVGKRVRSETRINEGNPSMGTAAAELASRQLGDLSDVRAIVIGAGEMGKLVAKPLADRGAELLITNRTYDSAKELAQRVAGTPICFEAIHGSLSEVDLVVTATDAPHPILDAATFDETNVTVLDLANPPDVADPARDLDSVTLFDIDDIGSIVDSAMATRTEAATEAERIVDTEMEALERDLKKREADEMLSTIYDRAEELRQAEVNRAQNRLNQNGGLTEREREILDDLGSALVNKLLSTPTRSIKQAAVAEDYETLRTVADVFEVPEAPPEEPVEPDTEEQADG
ncbi:glutamyl-tRNA reductase [Halodesulfurarchaeum formicicum]|uniref:Glutamyl-tRNA reductase n=1 Tax=Halodesulfurarchaeum formicicum TaxID=1873524 RepID=A0A1J1A912_9EURY|nr:glutamyl-tRNA reductase [Halodesulfurarchaeum formicicum]APE94602.1 glutamyl-tRNA reductase [Halodesulfurarchaeum formicicum]